VNSQLPAWSPLNNPQLRAAVEEKRHHRYKNMRQGGEFERYIFERYAWQEYPVKYGRWRKINDLRSIRHDSMFATRWVWHKDLKRILLLDPATRQPIRDHKLSAADVLPEGATSVWFAGDARVCGYLTPVGDGGKFVFGSLFNWMPVRTALALQERGPELAAKPYTESTDSFDGPWLADHPEMPPGQGPTIPQRLFAKLRR
jgi:hypothetical protein